MEWLIAILVYVLIGMVIERLVSSAVDENEFRIALQVMANKEEHKKLTEKDFAAIERMMYEFTVLFWPIVLFVLAMEVVRGDH